jgi:hypothetical protein
MPTHVSKQASHVSTKGSESDKFSLTSSDDSSSDSPLDSSPACRFSATGAGTGGGNGGVGSAGRNGAGRFILFIRCST